MLSKVILGTVQFGLNYGINNTSKKPTREQIFNLLDYAFSKGINTLDTADAYGDAINTIGAYNKMYPGRFQINSKFKCQKNKKIEEQLYISLGDLNMQNLHVYFYHSCNDLISFPETLVELVKLKKDSVIDKIGLSIYSNDEFEIAIKMSGIDVIQIPFNVLDNLNKRGKLIELAKENGKEVQARSIFLQGALFMNIDSLPSWLQPLKPYVKMLAEVSKLTGLSIMELVFLYVISQPGINQFLVGVDNIQHLESNIQAIEACSKQERESILPLIDQIDVKEIELLNPSSWVKS
ncbi:MAG: aldo/keto reductase [Hydrotalea sp.]|nr:aldo/keto reductase [Hydrotalea sp.]